MKKNSILLLLFFVQLAFGQENKLLSGEISISDATPAGVEIVNVTNKQQTVVDAKGIFVITAKSGDTLLFSAVHLNVTKKIISEGEYKSGKFFVRMTSKINELDEVTVNSNINAVDLRIIPTAIKSKTAAERRLRTAGDFKAWHLLKIISGGMELDPIFNKISGRTKQKKKELQIENKELLLQKIDNQFEADFFTEKLKIPTDYVNGFKYYLIEDADFVKAINQTDRINTEFIMSKLADSYNKMLVVAEKK
ncbi:MAG: hypothetical protein PSV16_13780 [Flavobacterium sp.]|nr:hypothetical protein [Flavobacterium sp.]